MAYTGISAGQPIKASDVTSALDSKADDDAVVKLTGAQSIGGQKTFTTSPLVPGKTAAAANSGTVLATEAQVYNVSTALDTLSFFPVGTILTFSTAAWNAKTSTAFRNTWKICNTANHAANAAIPDLTNKFLRGAESSGSTAGADSVSLTASHIPSHTHTFSGTSSGGSSHSHGLSGNTGTGGSHTHDTHTGKFSFADEENIRIAAVNYVSGVFSGEKRAEANSYFDGEGASARTHNNTVVMSATHSTHNGHTHSLSSGTIGGESAHTHTYSGTTGGYGASAVTAVPTVPGYYTVIYIIKVS